MMMLLLMACEAPDSWADCTVDEAYWLDDILTMTTRRQWDEEGRLVSVRSELEAAVVTERTTWENECPVLAESAGAYDGVLAEYAQDWERTVATVCDAYDDRIQVTTADRTEDGDTETEVVAFENAHDGAGRLTAVTEFDGEGAVTTETTYTWATCDAPVATDSSAPDGQRSEIRVTCNDAGQTTEWVQTWTGADGATIVNRNTTTYDADGKWLRRDFDLSEGPNDEYAELATWDDPDAPGPTEVETVREGAVGTRTTYTYDCPP